VSRTGEHKKTDSRPTSPNPRVLLVEDDEVLRAAYERILGKANFEVTAVDDVKAALREIAVPVEVIVSDIGLPGLSGIDLLKRVRATDLDVPVILITGEPSVETAASAVEQGAFLYLSKPVAPEKLLGAVRRALATGRLGALKREAMRLNGEGNAEGTADKAGLQTRFQNATDRMWMAFQPIVSLKTNSLFGYEALLRTDEPTFANPVHFLDAAQRLGAAHKLGRIVRAKIAEAAKTAPPEAKLFVNVHAGELDDFELYSATSPLAAFANRVVIEITERHSLDAITGVSARMSKLRELGYSVAVDDLGAGYAGLSSFSILEPEYVKLDMSLIRGVDTSKRKESVVRSMLSLCERELQMQVICEGVETAAECNTLAALGCDLTQGYFFARPAKGFAPDYNR
jgi:EAL domain-containing protein (putative c-di-GMP-specific phosphodiesterase class I)/CheY-like chemotaxis protein